LKTTYFIWKNPLCGGINPEWQEITGQAFYALVKSHEGRNRRFVKLPSTNGDGSDGVIVMESTEIEYRKWRKEKRHTEYLQKVNPGYKQVSYHALESDDGCYGEELIGDIDISYDEIELSMLRERLQVALKSLSENDMLLIDLFYRQNKKQPEIAEMLGITQQAVSKKLKSVLEKLKNQIL